MSEAPLPGRVRAHVLVPFAVITMIWGSTWLVIRDQLGVVPPGWSVTYRFASATIAMFLYAIVTRTPLRIGRADRASRCSESISAILASLLRCRGKK